MSIKIINIKNNEYKNNEYNKLPTYLKWGVSGCKRVVIKMFCRLDKI